MTSEIIHLSHQKSASRRLISDIRRQMSNVWCLMSNLSLFSTSLVWCLVSDVWCLMPDVWCQTSDVWYMSGVRRLMSQVFYTRNNYFLSVKIVFYHIFINQRITSPLFYSLSFVMHTIGKIEIIPVIDKYNKIIIHHSSSLPPSPASYNNWPDKFADNWPWPLIREHLSESVFLTFHL